MRLNVFFDYFDGLLKKSINSYTLNSLVFGNQDLTGLLGENKRIYSIFLLNAERISNISSVTKILSPLSREESYHSQELVRLSIFEKNEKDLILDDVYKVYDYLLTEDHEILLEKNDLGLVGKPIPQKAIIYDNTVVTSQYFIDFSFNLIRKTIYTDDLNEFIDEAKAEKV